MQTLTATDTNFIDNFSLWQLLFSNKGPTKMLAQRYIDLRVEFDGQLLRNKTLDPGIRDKISQTFAAEPSWFNAYQIEQYLTQIADAETLENDLIRCLDEYKAHLDEANHDQYLKAWEALHQDADEIDAKRALLRRMQTELHSFYTKRSERRDYAFLTRVRIGFCSLFGVVFFLATLAYCSFSDHIDTASEMIPIVVAAGFLGASFSMILGLKNQLAEATLEDLKVLHRTSYILKRLFIGITAALVTYFLIQAGFLEQIVSTDMLPELPIEDNVEDGAKDGVKGQLYLQVSKLIIWSFLAGFSEILVPGILQKVETRVSEQRQD